MGVKNHFIDGDAFASGQIASKLWLCEELERLPISTPQIVWIYGGWYGLTNFLLRSRARFPVQHVRSFDIDPRATAGAYMINDNWVQSHEFAAYTLDCNVSHFSRETPTLIINTSTEHFDSYAWFEAIPRGMLVALQSNDMEHEHHLFRCTSEADMRHRFPLECVLYSGHLAFEYLTTSFTRFMLIGHK